VGYLALTALSLSSLSGFAYDEVYEDDGRRRPAYELLQRRLGWDPTYPPRAVAERLGRNPLGDDHAVLPVPLALGSDDYRVITDGVAQRARALQAFYVDAFLGEQQYLHSGTSLTSKLLDEMLAAVGMSVDYFRVWWQDHDRAEARFVYGPDLVRSQTGRWVVLEDNVGCVGGCADAHYVTDAYFRAADAPIDPPQVDLVRAIEHWLATLKLAPDDPGVVAVLSDGDTLREYVPARFEEDKRRAELLRGMGIAVIDDDAFEKACRQAHTYPNALTAIVNIGVISPETWPVFRDVAFGQRHTPILNAPGTVVLGHKALLPYVDDMTRFYLDEDPILGSPETLLLRQRGLPDDVEDWVVKTATGCRCDGVFVLRWQQPDKVAALGQLVRHSWTSQASVAQRYVEPSRIVTGGEAGATYRVEVRALAYVTGWQEVVVSEQTVGKLAASDPPGLLNDVFRHASYAAVIRSDS